jgi:hypothetical protein
MIKKNDMEGVMTGLVLKWTGEARSDVQQRIRDLFPSGIPVIRRGDTYEMDSDRVSAELLCRCREMAFGSVVDPERREALMQGPLLVAYEHWLERLGLAAVDQVVDTCQLMFLFQ